MDIFLPCEAKGIRWQHVSDAAFRASVPNSWVSEVKREGCLGALGGKHRSPAGTVVKKQPANAEDPKHGFDLWVRKTPWRRDWQPPPVSLPGDSHGQRSLVSASPQGCKELDTIELHTPHQRQLLIFACFLLPLGLSALIFNLQ